MLLLHISDTHLGKRQYNLDEREQDIYDTFTQLIDLAIEERVKAVIHTGDLFDQPNPSNNALYHAMKEVKRLTDTGIQFLSIPGDHDTPKRSGEKFPQKIVEAVGLKLLLDTSIELQDGNVKVRIVGIKHKPSIVAEELVEQLKNTKPVPSCKNVIMLHQGIRQILPYAYSWQISQGDIPQGFDYYALGHFHTRILQRFGGGTLGVAGSPDIIREDEIEGYKSQGKGAFLVDLSSSEPSVQKMKVDIRPQEVVQIKAENYKEEIDKLMNEIPVKFKGPKKPILHVKVDGNSNKGLMSYISKLQEVVLHYKLEFLLQNLKSGDVVIPSNSTIDELISKFLEGKGYSREEVELILGMFKDIDNEENVKSSLRKVGGVPQ